MEIQSKLSKIPLSGAEFLEFIQPLVTEGISVKFRAQGRSMAPFIREGDVITICPKTRNRIRLGDVVAIRHPNTGGLVAHRVVKQFKNACLVQADNAVEADGIVAFSSVIGVVTEVQRNGRETAFRGKWRGPLIALLVRWGIISRLNSLKRKMKR